MKAAKPFVANWSTAGAQAATAQTSATQIIVRRAFA
jgi:hypothetical protein